LAVGKSGNRVIDWTIAWLERRHARSTPAAVNMAPDQPLTGSPDDPIRTRESGFTMIELLIVVSLIVILTTMGMTQYQHSVIYAREGVLKEDLFRIRDAIDQYYADKGQYPSTLDALVSDGYVRKLPDDPFTKSNSSWQTVPAEPDPNNPTAEAGVYDVKSGSEATALDGTKYSDW
jgi:general secretion pathway protein G